MTDKPDDDARALKIWRRRVTIFVVVIVLLCVFALALFGSGDSKTSDSLPIPISLAGLVVVYTVYAFFDLRWVRKHHRSLTEWGFRKKGGA